MYGQRITREYPTTFIFVLDQSSSMSQSFGDSGKAKSEAVATALNRLIQELILAATKETLHHYYDFGVLGYGSTVGSIIQATDGDELVSVEEVNGKPLSIVDRTRRVPDGAGGLVEERFRMPVWVLPRANGHTPMYEAFQKALDLAERAAARYPRSYPPTVIHITDGEYTTADPSDLMRRIQEIGTEDGRALLYNIHISSHPGAIFLPDSETGLPDEYARMLFRNSSVLPESCRRNAEAFGIAVSERTRGFAYNADGAMLVQFLEIGSGSAAPAYSQRLLRRPVEGR